jgi:hypothetical protein
VPKRPPRIDRELEVPRDLRGDQPTRALVTAAGELWRGDVMEMLGRIPDGGAALVVTDPPYAIVRRLVRRVAG